jgi:uncharacterized repeat protein (TIGR03803 family)
MSRARELLTCVVLSLGIACNWAFADPYRIVHNFTGVGADGERPNGGMVSAGSTLYGTTEDAGHATGMVFAVNTDGTGFQSVHGFTGGVPNGHRPEAGLILVGTTLYGTAWGGGWNFNGPAGSLYKVNTDGTGFQDLVSFDPFPFNGAQNTGTQPRARMTHVDGSFYTTLNGGQNFRGSLYKIGPLGGAIKHFTASENTGNLIETGLTSVGSRLYGVTDMIIYSISTTAGNLDFQVLDSFSSQAEYNGGTTPLGDLVPVGSKLYGTTSMGGVLDEGTVFSINLDGTDFQIVHAFEGAEYGAKPVGSVTQVGTELYGTTEDGGANNEGVLYRMKMDGTAFEILHEFGASGDGQAPTGDLLLVGASLYGTTRFGGPNNRGTVFAYALPEPSTFVLAGAALATIAAVAWRRRTSTS